MSRAPGLSFTLSASVYGGTAISPGMVLVPDGVNNYVPATAANRAAIGRRSEAIAYTPYGGNLPGGVQIQEAGTLDASLSGLAVGTASWVRCSSVGVVERFTPANGGNSDVIGYCETDGRVHLLFGVLTESIVVGGGGSVYVPPTGTGIPHIVGGVQNTAATLVVDADVSASAALAVSKLAPGSNGQTLQTVAGVSAWAASASFTPPTGTGFVAVTAGALNAAAIANLTPGSGFIGIGAGTLAGIGGLRYPYAATDVLIGAKDSGGTDREIISRVGADSYQIGPNAGGSLNMAINGANVTLTGAAQVVTSSVAATTISAGTNLNLNGASGYTVQINVGAATYIYVDGASQATQFVKPIKGCDFAPNLPYRKAVATVAGAPTSVTATNAQYACPIINVTTGTAAAAFKLILPLVLGAEWVVTNLTTFALTVGGATGATTNAIPAGGTGLCVCYNGTDFTRV